MECYGALWALGGAMQFYEALWALGGATGHGGAERGALWGTIWCNGH